MGTMRFVILTASIVVGLVVQPLTFAQAARAPATDEDLQSEMIARLLRHGMNNQRSDKQEDIRKIVCEVRERVGSRVKDLICGSNATLALQREINLSGYSSSAGKGNKESEEYARIQEAIWVKSFGEFTGANAMGPLLIQESTSRGRVMAQIEEFASEGTDEENRNKLLHYMIRSMFTDVDGRKGWAADELASFVMAYRKIGELEQMSFASDAEMENAMVEAITGNNLTIAMYNALTDDVMSDQELRLRVLLCLKVEI